MKESILGLVFAATMIRPPDHPDSIVAQLLLVSAFLHSLDPKRKLASALRERPEARVAASTPDLETRVPT